MLLWAPASHTAVAAVVTERISFAELSGWTADRHGEAFAAFRRSCQALAKVRKPTFAGISISPEAWSAVCRQAATIDSPSDADARAFFERHFTPFAVGDDRGRDGLFTGYFEPEYRGARTPSVQYIFPLLRKPPELVHIGAGRLKARSGEPMTYASMASGTPKPFFTRREIDNGALAGRGLELVYLESPIDAFFAHVQGSARIRLAEGGVMRVGFAAKNGHPYTAIGKVLVDAGEIALKDVSMQTIRAWLSANPDRADQVMWQNDSYIFFREVTEVDEDLGPVGAAQVPLTPGRSLAVDKAIHAYGLPVWVETTAPSGPNGAREPFRRLMVTQDTGSAIIGAVRGDVFWGSGDRAGEIAGLMKDPGRMYVLVPSSR